MAGPETISNLDQAKSYRNGQAASLKQRAITLSELREDTQYQQARELVVFDRWEHLAQKTPEFKEKTWQEASGAFSAGCNNGVKARLWIEIANFSLPGTYISTDDLYDRYQKVFSGTEILKATKRRAKENMIEYCSGSLCRVGLVSEEKNIAGKLIGYGITQDGKKYLDAAYLTLWWENNNNQSLFPLLGITASKTDNRSPITRARILDYIMRHPYNVRTTDLRTNLQIKGGDSTRHSLELFSQLGLANYTAITTQTGKLPLRYEGQEDKDLSETGYFTSAHEMEDLVKEAVSKQVRTSTFFSISDIVALLPDNIKQRWNNNSLRSGISSLLSALVRAGYLTRVHQFQGAIKLSEAEITQEGRSFVLSFIWPVLSIVEGRPLTSGQIERIRQAQANIDNYARNSAELYFPHSQSAKMSTREENRSKLFLLLSETEHPLSKSDLAEKIGVSLTTIGEYLKPYIKGSNYAILEINERPVKVRLKKIKGVIYYSIN